MDFTTPGFSRLSPVPRDIWEYCAPNVIEVNVEGQLRAIGAAGVSAWAAHALAWAAGVWLAFWPTYQGVSVTATLPGESAGEATRFSATAIEANGLHIVLLLLVPILLTGIALLALQLTDNRQTRRKVLLWVPVVVLLAACPRNSGP